MYHTRQMGEDIFADVIEKVRSLTISQQKFLQEMLTRHEKLSTASKKKLLKKSFGVWAGRKDIKDSIGYVKEMRKGWESRLERVKS